MKVIPLMLVVGLRHFFPIRKMFLVKLFGEIAPRYVHRPGGYTRIIPLGKRISDTATMARLEWVQ